MIDFDKEERLRDMINIRLSEFRLELTAAQKELSKIKSDFIDNMLKEKDQYRDVRDDVDEIKDDFKKLIKRLAKLNSKKEEDL